MRNSARHRTGTLTPRGCGILPSPFPLAYCTLPGMQADSRKEGEPHRVKQSSGPPYSFDLSHTSTICLPRESKKSFGRQEFHSDK